MVLKPQEEALKGRYIHVKNKQAVKCKKSKEEVLESKCLQDHMQEHVQIQNIERGRMVSTLFE